MTEKQLYQVKNEYLATKGERFDPFRFYRYVWSSGTFERTGHPEDQKANGILSIITPGVAYNRVIYDDLAAIDEGIKADFSVCSLISYYGRQRTAERACLLYGFTFDVDGVGLPELANMFYQIEHKMSPVPTFIANSGHGVHVYLIFDKPVIIDRTTKEALKDFKYTLLSRYWNRLTSTLKEKGDVQYQGIFQGFRMIGSPSKLGKKYPVTAYKTGEKVSIEYLNSFLSDDETKADFSRTSCMTLKEAKERYPAWYQKRIVDGEPAGRWTNKRDLYEWWKKKMLRGAVVGHRYSCLLCLSAYAAKCKISEEELRNDALEFQKLFENMDVRDPFTLDDMEAALSGFTEKSVKFSRKEIERISGIPIPANKRNGRTQAAHLKRLHAFQTIDDPGNTWINRKGRPKGTDQSYTVRSWQINHTGESKAQCIRDTGLSKSTVYRWWDDTL